MQPDGMEFASLLCSRLCHDLLSPIGAMNNGLELLADEQDPEMRARVIELLAESAQTSAAKLKFFRLAFGAAGGFGETVDTREARVAIEGLFGARTTVNWLVADAAMEKSALKVLLNLAMIAGDALVRGGRLDLAAEGPEIVVRAEGPRILLDGELRRRLEGARDAGPTTARSAPAVLVRSLVDDAGGTLQLSAPDDPVLVFGAQLPHAAVA